MPGLVTSNDGLGIYQVIGLGLLVALVIGNFFFRVIWLERIIAAGYMILIVISLVNTLILTSIVIHASANTDIKVSVTYENLLIPFFYFIFSIYALQRIGQLKEAQTVQG